MLDRHDDRTINAIVDDVLTTLRENLVEHQAIMKEAREGYLAKAEKALYNRIAQLERGELVELTFDLRIPRDHSKDFETIIKMLELHKDAWDRRDPGNRPPATIALKSADVQKYVLNNWDWADDFFLANSRYSQISTAAAVAKGLM